MSNNPPKPPPPPWPPYFPPNMDYSRPPPPIPFLEALRLLGTPQRPNLTLPPQAGAFSIPPPPFTTVQRHAHAGFGSSLKSGPFPSTSSYQIRSCGVKTSANMFDVQKGNADGTSVKSRQIQQNLTRRRPWRQRKRADFAVRQVDEQVDSTRSREPRPKKSKISPNSEGEDSKTNSPPKMYRRTNSDVCSSESSDNEKDRHKKRKKEFPTLPFFDERSAFNFNADFDAGAESTVSDTEEEDTELGEVPAKNWVQNTQAKLYYSRDRNVTINCRGSEQLAQIENSFESKVLRKSRQMRIQQPKLEPLPLPPIVHHCHHHHHPDEVVSSSCSSSSEEDDDYDIASVRHKQHSHPSGEDDDVSSCESDNESQRFKRALEELKRKEDHPARLHRDIWFNELDQMNDGPLCRCSWKARQTGIAHAIYPGEKRIEPCDPNSNNLNRLIHFRVDINPLTNFTTKMPTSIKFDDHEYVFQGFSIFTHFVLPENLPICRVVRWNIEYSLTLVKEEPPENFVVRDLDLFFDYFFVELLELYDVDLRPSSANFDEEGNPIKKDDDEKSCPMFHVMPRFVRSVENDGVEVLSMNNVLKYLTESYAPVFNAEHLTNVADWSMEKWDKFAERLKGQLVTNSNKRPSAIRVDQIDRQSSDPDNPSKYPVLVHFGIRPAVLTYTGNPEYQRAWKQYVKFRHLLLMKPKMTAEDRGKLSQKESNLQRLKAKASLKRDVTVEVSSENFYRTGINPDVVQHGLMLLVVFCHLRLHWSFAIFETERIKYKFKNHAILELAFTHPSYRSNYGTNPDHARNTLSNCGIRQPEYGNKRNQQIFTRKRGINTLIDIMSRMGSKKVKQSQVANNERLEYLGDAVIEFLSTIHLYFTFPDLQEGGLATYRSSLVQNRHLAVLAKKLGLEDFMLFAHGPDLCHEADLKHAMANAFEAVMGALFLDGGIDVVDRVYGNALFSAGDEPELNHVWFHLPKHPLQQQEPDGDRHWVEEVQVLKKLVEFENQTGIVFNHIRLLARAFTRKNVGYNFLTLGHNQRLEFLGDTVLQLVTSEFLYKHFPEHHEGHLSLLRSCLVKNKTQSVICDDLGMTNYVVHPPAFLKSGPPELRMKDKADLVEAFLGALYVDRGLEFCKAFCRVCLYPRLRYFIMSQKWNDPKSQLQQCCLTIRNPDGGEPDIPVYKVISVEGPTNTRVYKVAVYFRAKRLATGSGHSVQEAEMKAAEEALVKCASLFPHLEKQKTFIRRKFRNEYPTAPGGAAGGSSSRQRNYQSNRPAVNRTEGNVRLI